MSTDVDDNDTGLIIGLVFSFLCICFLLMLIWYYFMQNYVIVKKSVIKDLEMKAHEGTQIGKAHRNAILDSTNV